jgi:Tfp pilus assembly protein PilV
MNKRLRLRKLGSHGDTIVEVLIATAIASLVLVSAYAITTRNTRATQDVQENSYAQKLVEQQVELLRQNPAAATTDGCFDTTTDAHTYTPGACTVTVPGNGASYTVTVRMATAESGVFGARYQVQVAWQTINGVDANVTAYYTVEHT